jgi:hypothetical protein
LQGDWRFYKFCSKSLKAVGTEGTSGKINSSIINRVHGKQFGRAIYEAATVYIIARLQSSEVGVSLSGGLQPKIYQTELLKYSVITSNTEPLQVKFPWKLVVNKNTKKLDR